MMVYHGTKGDSDACANTHHRQGALELAMNPGDTRVSCPRHRAQRSSLRSWARLFGLWRTRSRL